MNDQETSNERQLYTLDEALGVVGFGRCQVIVLLYAGIGCIAEAMEVMILSFVGPAVNSQWGISSSQESLLTTMVFAGMLIGAYCWGIIADSFGRRMGLLSVAVMTTVPAFLCSFSPNYKSLVILRMLVGIGLGGGPVYTSWFLEFVPAQNRGKWMVLFSAFWTAGTILEASLAWIIMPRLGWRWLLAVSSIPAFAALFFYSFTIESPRYLYMKGRINDADQILKRIAAVNRTELPCGVLIADQITELEKECCHSKDTQLLSRGRSKTAVPYTCFSSLLALYSSRLIRTTLLLWVIYFGNSFAYYGIILLTSELSSDGSSCGSIILNSKSSDDPSLYRDVFITSFAELPGILLSGIIVDSIGRKVSMGVMYVLSGVILLPLISHQHEILTTTLLFGARMCIIGTFTVAGVYCPEIYPTSVRTTGVGVASAVGRIAGMICPAVAVGLVSDCHQTSAIILFEVVIFMSAVSVVFIPHETKGRQLTDTVAVSN